MFRHMELKRSKKMCDMDYMVTTATMYGHMHIYIYTDTCMHISLYTMQYNNI